MSSPFRRQVHSDRVVYIVSVLWLIGHSQSTIASVLHLRRKQVAGIINNSEYNGRSRMSDTEIREKLKELEAIRFGDDGMPLDGGSLNRIAFVPQALSRRQRGPLKRKIRHHG